MFNNTFLFNKRIRARRLRLELVLRLEPAGDLVRSPVF